MSVSHHTLHLVSNPVSHFRRQLGLTNGKKFTLIGTPQGHEHKDPAQLDLPDVFNDLDIDFSADPNSEAVIKFKNDVRNRRKIKEAVEALMGCRSDSAGRVNGVTLLKKYDIGVCVGAQDGACSECVHVVSVKRTTT